MGAAPVACNRRAFLLGVSAAAATAALPTLPLPVKANMPALARAGELYNGLGFRPLYHIGRHAGPPFHARIGDVYFDTMDGEWWQCIADKDNPDAALLPGETKPVLWERTWAPLTQE